MNLGLKAALIERYGSQTRAAKALPLSESRLSRIIRGWDQPHDNEIYAQMQMYQPSYPGEQVVLQSAEDYCLAQFPSFVGKSYESSILDVTYIYPTQESWNQVNDREISCAGIDMNLDKLVGTTKGSRI